MNGVLEWRNRKVSQTAKCKGVTRVEIPIRFTLSTISAICSDKSGKMLIKASDNAARNLYQYLKSNGKGAYNCLKDIRFSSIILGVDGRWYFHTTLVFDD